jgi:acetylglutamate kinase
VLNVNADSVAGAVAGALGAPVVFLSDVPGVLDDPQDSGSLIAALSEEEVGARIEDGRIAGGMIPKVEAALKALRQGASFAVIADGRDPLNLKMAALGRAGTRLYRRQQFEI